MRKYELCVIMAILFVMTLVFCSCHEQQRIWGQGDPPADWQGFFGNSNIARLNFAQMQVINRQGQAMVGFDERIRELESMADVNDINDADLNMVGAG